jgi:hypothetical protein
LILAASLAACGPSVRGGGDDDDDGDGGGGGTADAWMPGPCEFTEAETTPATCGDGRDNDCNGKTDCQDSSCSGVGDCPVCGEVTTSAGSGITLPDGVIGSACTTDAQCTDPSLPSCVESECHASYVSTLNVIGFGQNQTFTDAAIIESVCVTMEHSWMRDLELHLTAPGGQTVRLQMFAGRTGGEIYLGQANDCDEGSPVAGIGEVYCWRPTATNPPTIPYADGGGAMGSAPSCILGSAQKLPPGDYSADDPWDQLIGSPMNGEWKFVVTDLWPIDNGFLFDWTIVFNADAIDDCSGPIIE